MIGVRVLIAVESRLNAGINTACANVVNAWKADINVCIAPLLAKNKVNSLLILDNSSLALLTSSAMLAFSAAFF